MMMGFQAVSLKDKGDRKIPFCFLQTRAVLNLIRFKKSNLLMGQSHSGFLHPVFNNFMNTGAKFCFCGFLCYIQGVKNIQIHCTGPYFK